MRVAFADEMIDGRDSHHAQHRTGPHPAYLRAAPEASSPRAVCPYLLTPKSRVLLEELTGFQLVKKLPAFYGTRRFITAFTSTRHLSLS
jgi:hypothetical protein